MKPDSPVPFRDMKPGPARRIAEKSYAQGYADGLRQGAKDLANDVELKVWADGFDEYILVKEVLRVIEREMRIRGLKPREEA